MSRLASSAVVAALGVASPRLAQACAVCFTGREGDVQTAFIVSTAFMSVMPLIVIGGAVWWLRRRLREMEEHAAAPLPEPGTE